LKRRPALPVSSTSSSRQPSLGATDVRRPIADRCTAISPTMDEPCSLDPLVRAADDVVLALVDDATLDQVLKLLDEVRASARSGRVRSRV